MHGSANSSNVVLDYWKRVMRERNQNVDYARTGGGLRIWLTPEATHIDVRGLEPPEPMLAILHTIESSEVDTVLIAHLDREPVFLYPELDDRGWSHEVIPSPNLDPDNADSVTLRIVRAHG